MRRSLVVAGAVALVGVAVVVIVSRPRPTPSNRSCWTPWGDVILGKQSSLVHAQPPPLDPGVRTVTLSQWDPDVTWELTNFRSERRYQDAGPDSTVLGRFRYDPTRAVDLEADYKADYADGKSHHFVAIGSDVHEALDGVWADCPPMAPADREPISWQGFSIDGGKPGTEVFHIDTAPGGTLLLEPTGEQPEPGLHGYTAHLQRGLEWVTMTAVLDDHSQLRRAEVTEVATGQTLYRFRADPIPDAPPITPPTTKDP